VAGEGVVVDEGPVRRAAVNLKVKLRVAWKAIKLLSTKLPEPCSLGNPTKGQPEAEGTTHDGGRQDLTFTCYNMACWQTRIT